MLIENHVNRESKSLDLTIELYRCYYEHEYPRSCNATVYLSVHFDLMKWWKYRGGGGNMILPNTMIYSTSFIISSDQFCSCAYFWFHNDNLFTSGHICLCVSRYLPSKYIWVWTIFIDYTWINNYHLYFLIYHENKSKQFCFLTFLYI